MNFIVFPGQGSQKIGMGKKLSEDFTEAKEVFEEAKTSEDFDAMVEKYTDDSHPGIYKMANFTFAGNREFSSRDNWIHERGGMVPAFGNVGFQLKVGEVGMSAQDVKDSPYGWHIIKRLE